MTYTLITAYPVWMSKDEYWTRVTLSRDNACVISHEEAIIWSHAIAGIDPIQSLLLAWKLAQNRMLDEGGYTFLGSSDLGLTHG
ncbi:hypothetical protein EJ419_04640 [Alloscardovia theropitheci]|uniref:Uncharacterized protein n=1 Tax=Alloscardovia theropitheci TaxID=2496842 RepID=A0A4R0QVQ2_9BIFI|nr:hypothetical protein [Alloscardovia theropitheci]TCD54327.1 hypothetical protein EJ419_04640 [Alloscardovia theropitheci]